MHHPQSAEECSRLIQCLHVLDLTFANIAGFAGMGATYAAALGPKKEIFCMGRLAKLKWEMKSTQTDGQMH